MTTPLRPFGEAVWTIVGHMSQSPEGRSPIDREEMESLLAVRQELGSSMEPALVDSFADKILVEVQRQTQMNLAAHQQHQMEQARGGKKQGAGRLALAIVSLVMAIPLTAIALDLSSIWMAAIVWIGIVLVNFVYGNTGRDKT